MALGGLSACLSDMRSLRSRGRVFPTASCASESPSAMGTVCSQFRARPGGAFHEQAYLLNLPLAFPCRLTCSFALPDGGRHQRLGRAALVVQHGAAAVPYQMLPVTPQICPVATSRLCCQESLSASCAVLSVMQSGRKHYTPPIRRLVFHASTCPAVI